MEDAEKNETLSFEKQPNDRPEAMDSKMESLLNKSLPSAAHSSVGFSSSKKVKSKKSKTKKSKIRIDENLDDGLNVSNEDLRSKKKRKKSKKSKISSHGLGTEGSPDV